MPDFKTAGAYAASQGWLIVRGRHVEVDAGGASGLRPPSPARKRAVHPFGPRAKDRQSKRPSDGRPNSSQIVLRREGGTRARGLTTAGLVRSDGEPATKWMSYNLHSASICPYGLASVWRWEIQT